MVGEGDRKMCYLDLIMIMDDDRGGGIKECMWRKGGSGMGKED